MLPLLPISFTLFWQISTLHGTVSLLKSLKCLKKILLNNNLKSDNESKEPKRFKYAKYSKIELENEIIDERVNFTNSNLKLSHDDLSQINELSSIDSLINYTLAPTENTKLSKRVSNYFAKLKKKAKFYLRTVDLILFSKPILAIDDQVDNDLDIQNASFIYYSNFLIGLGIITVK